ncbi:unnamed protein product [Didymodactylos carnosus]|uniref:VWFA domain-containing protein n=1 Tax=Didymodactylos carnosus TaxID=1234261 RepID=A0A814ZJY1_9BILA|nr:unnamed protein product [Didymodactylos carnosus]CAF4006500.1 unnamed protein product [Didymodactylos carnosus]
MIDLTIKEFRSHWENLNLSGKHQIYWCIMVDNSGSMVDHRNIDYEVLVVIMEVLRKLESKFAVARFGSQTHQKILKNFNDLFTNQDGQYVLEALTFNEGTYPATGLARIAHKIFPVTESAIQPNIVVHRLVLMLTDGLTHERNYASYLTTIYKNQINLGFMFIETADQSSSRILLRDLKQVENCVLKTNSIAELPLEISELMHKMIKKSLKITSILSLQSRVEISSMINIKVPNIREVTLFKKPRLMNKSTPI